MKPSSIVLIIIFLVIGFGIYKVVENNNKNPWEFYDRAIYERDMQSYEKDKNDKQNKLILFGILGAIGVSIIYYFVKESDNKKDPEKNLDKLLENNIINKKEYEEKKMRIELANVEKYKIKEKNKIIQELNNLKLNNIITEQEYNSKLELLNKKYEKN